MATISYDADDPGKGGSGPIFGIGSRPMKFATGTFAFDNSYPTGGEDLAPIWALFNNANGVSRLAGLVMEQPDPLTAQTGKRLRIDHTNRKVLLYDNAVATAQVANGSDQSLIAAVRWFAWGPR